MDDYILNIKTVQSGAVRILIEALKEILTDGNFIFDSSGVKLMAMDSTHTILIHMKLESSNFEFFYCPKKVTVGINMLNIFKLIKTMTNSETLTLFIEKNNENFLGIKINNAEKNSQTIYKLNLLDIPEDDIIIYCFKGARASNTFVALKEAGFNNIRNYFGSWNEWSRDPDLPIDEKILE